jgi:hypothetical protein
VLSAKRTIACLSPVSAFLVLLCWAQPGSAQTMKVGSFLKSTGGAPASQVVPHGLGRTPKALILWTDGKTNETFSAGFLFGLGMTDGTNSRSVAMASLNGASPSNASQRVAAKALALVQWGEALLAEADLTGWNATTFTLNWTTNNATAYVIHFIAIGGSDVSAKVVDWTMPTTLTPPDQPVTVA